MTLYHQTDRAATNGILQTQRFLRGKGGLAGGGIYFAKTAQETQRKALHTGVMLKADVSLGRIKDIQRGDSSITHFKLKKEGYDSVCIQGRASGLEYVVYNYDQVRNIREAASGDGACTDEDPLDKDPLDGAFCSGIVKRH